MEIINILYWPMSLILGYISLYTAVFYILLVDNKTRSFGPVVMSIAAVILVILAFALEPTDSFHSLMYILLPVVATICVAYDSRHIKSIVTIIAANMVISIMGSLVAGIGYSISSVGTELFQFNNSLNLVIEGINTLLVLGVALLVQAIRRKKGWHTRHDGASLFLLISLVSFFICMSPVTRVIEELAGKAWYKSTVFGLAVFSFAFLIGTLLVQIIVNRNILYKSQMETQRQYTEGQKAYYESMLVWNKQLRKIQHDTWAHYLCLQEHIAAGNISEASQYLNELLDMDAGTTQTIKTGNLVCDVVVNYLAEKHNVHFNIYGIMPSRLTFTEIEMCTILSNVLSNASQAASMTQHPSVDIHIKVFATHLHITIENNSEAKLNFKNGLPVSRKGINHGYGLRSVADIVERNGGKLRFEQNGQTVITELTLVDCIIE